MAWWDACVHDADINPAPASRAETEPWNYNDSAGRSDGGTVDVSTVDTELLTCSTPRGLARS